MLPTCLGARKWATFPSHTGIASGLASPSRHRPNVRGHRASQALRHSSSFATCEDHTTLAAQAATRIGSQRALRRVWAERELKGALRAAAQKLKSARTAQARETKRQAAEAKLEAKLDAKLEAQRNELEAKTHAQSRTDKLTALQLRLEVLSDSKLLEDEELAAIEDKVADAIGVAGVEDGAESVWDCVMQMIRLSEGIGSEKMFARQLRRKFL